MYINKMDKHVKKFCKNPTKTFFNKLSTELQEELIQTSFDVLFQKTGDQEKALEILQVIDQVDVIHGYTVYTGEMNLPTQLERLQRIGVTTIPIISVNELEEIQERFNTTLEHFPEYNRSSEDYRLNSVGDTLVYVLGGFAALGNPSSFHNPLVRELRVKCWKQVIKLFNKMIKRYYDKNLKDNYKIEVLFDRMMYRMAGQKAVAEAWHRDVMPPELIDQRDEVFGGWINLDNTNQYFSCIPGSHLGITQRDIPSGFDAMKKREIAIMMKKKDVKEAVKKMTKAHKDKYLEKLIKPIMNDVGKMRHRFKVPPGHMIIFPQYIMHEVVACAVKHNMYRLFLGWRMTVQDEPLRDNDMYMREQAVVPLPGGMTPPMYAASHQSQQLGIPTLKKLTKNQKKAFNLDKWSKDLNDKYMILYPTKRMIKLSKKLKKTKNKKNIIASMNEEYLDAAGVTLNFDKEQFINDDDMILSFRSVFRTNPMNDNSKTTLIKWSMDTIPAKFLKKQIYDGSGGKGTYMKAPRYMKSLKSYGLAMYPKYSREEKIIYKPNRVS
jgi:hypothetical protein